MTRNEFMDVIGEIAPELVESALSVPCAETVEPVYKRPPVVRYAMAFAACIAILVTIIIVRVSGGLPTLPNDASESAGGSSESAVINNPDFIRGWDPEELAYSDTLELGNNVRVSFAEADGITAELILRNITKEPGAEFYTGQTEYNYIDYVGAEDIVLYIRDKNGNRFLETNAALHKFDNTELIPAECLFGDCTRLYKTDSGYVLMQYIDFNAELNALIARFYDLDLESAALRDENGIYSGGLKPVRISVGGSSAYGFPASREQFEYVGGDFFRDRYYGYELRFAGENALVGYVDLETWKDDFLYPDIPAFWDNYIDDASGETLRQWDNSDVLPPPASILT